MYFLIIVLVYVFCFGVTDLLVAPLQSLFLPNLTVFASLLYLPHGVRVLATWAYGWRAIPALLLAGALSALLFRGEQERELLSPLLLESLLVGACCAFVAFEAARRLGVDVYFGQERRLRWGGVLIIGAFASFLNSAGQVIVYSGLVEIERLLHMALIYAVGDIFGLVFCMFGLMLVFRRLR